MDYYLEASSRPFTNGQISDVIKETVIRKVKGAVESFRTVCCFWHAWNFYIGIIFPVQFSPHFLMVLICREVSSKRLSWSGNL